MSKADELKEVASALAYHHTVGINTDNIQEDVLRLRIENERLQKENAILEKALRLYVDWADECGIAWDNFPDMTEKWYKKVEEKGLGWIDGLIFMVKEEAKEQFLKEIEK